MRFGVIIGLVAAMAVTICSFPLESQEGYQEESVAIERTLA